MRKMTVGVVALLVFGFGILLSGQNAPIANSAGTPFPLAQYSPNRMTARRVITNGITRLEDVEIRTMGVVLRADEAELDVATGEYQLRGNVRATLIHVKPIWPEPQP